MFSSFFFLLKALHIKYFLMKSRANAVARIQKCFSEACNVLFVKSRLALKCLVRFKNFYLMTALTVQMGFLSRKQSPDYAVLISSLCLSFSLTSSQLFHKKKNKLYTNTAIPGQP